MPFRMMVIAAHPDDEALGFGGLLARTAAAGDETYLVTATRGDRGRYLGHPPGHPAHPGRDELAALRERELEASAQVLGVREVTQLGYPDQQLDSVPVAEVVGRLSAQIRRVRPHVVVTFGPDGGYGHPDHIAVSQFAAAAVLAAAQPSRQADYPEPHSVSKLYYLAWTESEWAAYQAAFKTLTSTVDGVVRQAVPWPHWAVTTVVDTRPWWSVVWSAIQCHRSQIGAYQVLWALSDTEREALFGTQSLYRAQSLVNGGRQRETDVFDGLLRYRAGARDWVGDQRQVVQDE
ncbi:MAG: PIG-L deacetylase family protein [Vicinamibacterales bacterium]